MLLGAGRARMDSRIDPCGRSDHCTRKAATQVRVGEPLCTVLVNDESRLEEALALINGAFRIVQAPSLCRLSLLSGSPPPRRMRLKTAAGTTVIDQPAKR